MDWAKNVFDSIYYRFILRDFFGKMIPGFIVLIAIAAAHSLLDVDNKLLKYINFWLWLTIMGLSWITGFFIQSIGEWRIKNFYYYPENSYDEKNNYEHFLKKDMNFKKGVLRKYKSEREQDVFLQQHERFCVIKEACGNSFVAVAFAMAYTMIDFAWYIGVRWWSGKLSWGKLLENIYVVPDIILGVLALIFLKYMHSRHVKRQKMVVDIFFDP